MGPPIAPPSPSVDVAVRRMPCVVGIAIFTSAMISSISPQATAMIAPSTTILFVTPSSEGNFRPRHALKWDPPAASLFYGPAQLSEKLVTPFFRSIEGLLCTVGGRLRAFPGPSNVRLGLHPPPEKKKKKKKKKKYSR